MFLVFIFKKHLVDSEIKIHLLNKVWGVWQRLGRGTGYGFIMFTLPTKYVSTQVFHQFICLHWTYHWEFNFNFHLNS